MKAVLLCGGKATRLGELAATTPKALLPLAGKPLLQHQLDNFKRHGITDIVLLEGHLAQAIQDYYGDGSRHGLTITHVVEEQPLGTAGALPQIARHCTEPFFVVYGDMLYDVDLEQVQTFQEEHGGVGTIVVHPNNHPHTSHIVTIDRETNLVTGFHRHPHAPTTWYRNLVNSGLYLFTPEIFEHIKPGVFQGFAEDVFPAMLTRGVPLHGYTTTEYFKDVGSMERRAQAEQDYQSGVVARRSRITPRPAVFLDRDGTIIEHIPWLDTPEQVRLLPGASRAIKLLNNAGYLAVITTNQPVIARGTCTIEQLHRIHDKLEWLLGGEGAYLDEVYYCPHHPDKGYSGENPLYKVPCDCRKPKTEMITRAVEELNIDLSKSYVVGDAMRDIKMGNNAGIKSIGLTTGEALKDAQEGARPDHTCPSLLEAVHYILENK